MVFLPNLCACPVAPEDGAGVMLMLASGKTVKEMAIIK